jgi:hypothetical protein
MVLEGKPCIVITDMNKKYHKLWINLLHELYHVVNDYDILENIHYHISDSESPDFRLGLPLQVVTLLLACVHQLLKTSQDVEKHDEEQYIHRPRHLRYIDRPDFLWF